MKIITKESSTGETIYSVETTPQELKYPIGYFNSEQEAIDAYNQAKKSF